MCFQQHIGNSSTFLACLFAALLVTQPEASAQALDSAFTELVRGRCRFISLDAQTNEEQVKKCPGVGGFEALTRSSHTNVFLGFRRGEKNAPQEVIHGWSLGEKIEWRSVRNGKNLQPFAAIARVIVKDPDTLVGGGQVLAVVRLHAGDACVAALVDAAANRQANDAARRTADDIARTFRCGVDKPVEAGVATKWTKSLLDQLQAQRAD
jgi:hypothetical protein